MNKINFILQLSILPNKYIILYIDNDMYDEEINNKLLINIKNIDNSLDIIRFLDKNEDKQILNLNQIYPDSYTENILIEHCLCIIYLSKFNNSNTLIDLINLYDKYVIYNKDDIINYIEHINNNNLDKIILLNENKNNFKNIYSSLLDKKITLNHDINLNIKLEYNKIHKELPYINDKIYIITHFKNVEINILKIVQKKCIIENLRNKNVIKVIVLGKNINNELQDIINDNSYNISNLELIEYDNEVTYKDLLDTSNKLLKESIVCILKSDIILPNQNELENLNFDLSYYKNEIYTLSRIERLINGNLIKSENLNRTLFSTEQDGWIFKTPINIDTNLFNNIIFYNKYSELYFNKILKSNNYNIINNSSKIKIIRILFENNMENRILLNNNVKIDNIDDVLLIPDSDIINKLSIDNLLNIFNINEKDINNIKCEIFNNYLKDMIIKNLIY
jgi:hypothetical protein